MFPARAPRTCGACTKGTNTRQRGDRLLTRFCWKTRGQHSGIERDLRWSQINTYRDGLVVFAEYFLDHEQALKAVGLEE